MMASRCCWTERSCVGPPESLKYAQTVDPGGSADGGGSRRNLSDDIDYFNKQYHCKLQFHIALLSLKFLSFPHLSIFHK